MFSAWGTEPVPVHGRDDRHNINFLTTCTPSSDESLYDWPADLLAEEICVGTLHAVACKIPTSAQRPTADQLKASIFLGDRHIALDLRFASARCDVGLRGLETAFAVVNNRIAKVLTELQEYHAYLRLAAYALHDPLKEKLCSSPGPGKAKDIIMHAHINLYCRGEQNVDALSHFLSGRKIYLQDPDWIETDLEIRNPHTIKFPGLSKADILVNELTQDHDELHEHDEMREDGISHDWTAVLDDLCDVEDQAPGIDLQLFIIPLKEHQIAGTGFMINRELGKLTDRARYWRHDSDAASHRVYQHAVTHARYSIASNMSQPLEPRGGILADEMGLGKTLTTLALVAASQDRAKPFAQLPPRELEQKLYTPTGSTLVVAPSTLILENWTNDLETKLARGLLTYKVYHGQNRVRHFSELSSVDLVLTTYGTVVREFRRQASRKVLFELLWFRIVLDEAHVVRSSRRQQFQAVNALRSIHRWCLTGTPISNKVDDLASLLQFCQVPLLEKEDCFKEFLVNSLRQSFKDGSDAIRKAMTPICLRRTRANLQLPGTHHQKISIELSPIERRQYLALMEDSRRAIDALVSGKSTRRSPMLQAILRLRIFCNMGLATSITKLDHEHALDPDEAMTMLQEREQTCCCICFSDIIVIDASEEGGSGVIASCSHPFCVPCYDEISNGIRNAVFDCPNCNSSVIRMQHDTAAVLSTDSMSFGSSKMNRLLEELGRHDSPGKSLVLSAWRKSILMVAKLCEQKGIRYIRIDGGIPQAERPRMLQQFMTDPAIPVMLMTMGTGSLGLNITAARTIHILEPQWNPSAELQAIGRLVRIGQENETTVIRYVVADSVEEQVQLYQKYKKRLAAAGFGDSSVEAAQVHRRLLNATFFQTRHS